VLLLGIHAEQRADLRALRRAYAALDRLRLTEAERAALEERSRLAREIHDGLAQHLWFAKLKFERLAAQVPEDARGLSSEVGQALDSAIVEARQAMVTMRTAIEQDMPLSDMISRAIDDFGQRSGIRVEYQADGLPGAIPPRQQIELLRIIQEAMTNIRKHADATVVRVKAEVVDGNLVVSVGDNGRGFDPENARDDGLGVTGMEERARLMGGQLHITSAPSDGTVVELTLPLILLTSVPGVDMPSGVSTATPPSGTPIVTKASPQPDRAVR
jgi:two-component system nitrate/nitrite sensor histidine kinase NarX